MLNLKRYSVHKNPSAVVQAQETPVWNNRVFMSMDRKQHRRIGVEE
jgi:hypothetical protein